MLKRKREFKWIHELTPLKGSGKGSMGQRRGGGYKQNQTLSVLGRKSISQSTSTMQKARNNSVGTLLRIMKVSKRRKSQKA